ncbi:GerAB/ArcD/ProY family transporter [Brevibacillus dissolubilis]|uniref:GerAB/ArcD/ProY family transporter n=1 Tax=Brevibacillus dissolubilis TaxID=1844116 RepID=UPI001117A6DB|nr:endospore germination permease [Brevibacillus dissolubilis]
MRISNHQIVLIGAMYVINSTLISLPAPTTQYAKQQVWLPPILCCLIILFIFWLLCRVLARFPDQDLFQVMSSRYPFWGKFVIGSFVLLYFMILTRDVRLIIDFFNVTLLPQTPLWVTGSLTVLTIVMIARGGVEILGRMTEFFAPALVIVILLIPVLLIKDFDYSFLMPYNEYDWQGIGIATWYNLPYFGEVLGMALIFSNRTLPFRLGVRALLLSTVLLIIIGMCSLLILGGQIVPRLMYPTYETVRQLRVTDFLDRFELPMIGVWLPTMLTKVAYSLYIVSYGIKRMFPQFTVDFIVTPLGYLTFVCSFWFFSDAIQLFKFNREWPMYALTVQILVPIMLYLFLRPKRHQLESGALEKT